MNKWLCFFCVMMVTVAFAQEGGNSFIYNDNAKKDPFEALVSPEGVLLNADPQDAAVDMVLEGIIVDARQNNLAILNGKVVKPGDVIAGYTVEKIAVDQVELIKEQERLTVKLKKGGG